MCGDFTMIEVLIVGAVQVMWYQQRAFEMQELPGLPEIKATLSSPSGTVNQPLSLVVRAERGGMGWRE